MDEILNNSNSKLLASCSDTIRLWELYSGTLLPTPVAIFNPHHQQLPSSISSQPLQIKWNHNNHVLASCGDDGVIGLSQTNGELLGKLRIPTSSSSSSSSTSTSTLLLNCLCFSAGSRLICCAGNDKSIYVWDLKYRDKVSKTFKDAHKFPITSICIRNDDKYVASGDSNGIIKIHSLSTGQLFFTPLSSHTLSITSLSYSPFNKNLLACSSDDGNITIFDTAKEEIHTKFLSTSTSTTTTNSLHDGKSCNIAFSPYNHLFMCSAGMDKKIIFYDVVAKKIIRSLTTDYELTSVSFLDEAGHIFNTYI